MSKIAETAITIKKSIVEQCVEYILEQNYGDTVLNAKLAQILGYDLKDEVQYRKYKSKMQKVKSKLVVHSYVLRSISGVGYYILKPEHIVNHCYRTYIQKVQKTLNKSLSVVTHIDTSRFMQDRLDEQKQFKELNAELIKQTSKMINNSGYYDRKAYYDSLGKED